MLFFKITSIFKSRSDNRVPSLAVYTNADSSVTLNTTTPNVKHAEFIKTLTCFSTGYKDGYKVIPKKIRGIVHTITSVLQGPAKDALTVNIQETFYLVLKDGGQLKLEVSDLTGPASTPILIAFHGVGGRGDAPYVAEPCAILAKKYGFRIGLVTERGCGGVKMTSAAFQNAGHVNDVGAVVAFFSRRFPDAPIFAIGGSLGSGMLGNFAGETGANCPIDAMALLSNVWDYVKSANSIPKVLDYVVGKELTKTYKKNAIAFTPEYAQDNWSNSSSSSSSSSSAFSRSSPPSLTSLSTDTLRSSDSASTAPSTGSSLHRTVPYNEPKNLRKLNEINKVVATKRLGFVGFAEHVVSATNGFDSGADLMVTTSSVNAIPDIRIPVLALNANDDPLLGGDDLPRAEMSTNAYQAMVVTRTGGHLGWFGKGRDGVKSESKRWSTRVAVEYFEGLMELGLKARPRAKIIPCGDGGQWWCPEGSPQMCFMETSSPLLGDLVLGSTFYKRS